MPKITEANIDCCLTYRCTGPLHRKCSSWFENLSQKPDLL